VSGWQSWYCPPYGTQSQDFLESLHIYSRKIGHKVNWLALSTLFKMDYLHIGERVFGPTVNTLDLFVDGEVTLHILCIAISLLHVVFTAVVTDLSTQNSIL